VVDSSLLHYEASTRIHILGESNLRPSEIVRTYLASWVAIPPLLIGPPYLVLRDPDAFIDAVSGSGDPGWALLLFIGLLLLSIFVPIGVFALIYDFYGKRLAPLRLATMIDDELPARARERDELPAPARPRIEEIVRRLAAGDIDGLRSEGVNGLDGDPLLWIREYPAKLVPLPADVWVHPETVTFAYDDRSGWAVVLPLWTTAESPSDLSLEMSVIKRGTGFEFEISSIHV
jgi:hypothetical protein